MTRAPSLLDGSGLLFSDTHSRIREKRTIVCVLRNKTRYRLWHLLRQGIGSADPEKSGWEAPPRIIDAGASAAWRVVLSDTEDRGGSACFATVGFSNFSI